MPPPATDLQVLLPSEGPPPLAERPALYLRPGPRLPAADDPAEALRRALAEGGVAVWGPPFDPARLLDVVGVPASKGRRASGPSRPSLAASPWPWIIVDAATRRVAWANRAARERFGLGEAGDVAPDVVPADVSRRTEGRATVDAGGRTALAAWWAEPGGRRCVGLVDLPAGGRGDEANLRALAEIGRMTSTFAHEVRNPIASLAGAIDLLREDLAPLERAEVASLAKDRLALMRRLLDDMLRLARPLRGEAQEFDLVPVVESTVAAMRTDSAFERVRLTTDLGGTSLRVRSYSEPMRQALTNLLLNAAEAQGGGGAVRVRLSAERGTAILRVEDDGPGIPADRRETVFDPFWTTKPKGTGLGLAFVRRVAEASGGRAFVEESASGATLRLDVPLA
jgi:signal transduction histidine kinase